MVVYGQVEAAPEENAKIAEYIVPANNFYSLESVVVWTNSDGQFTIYKNGEELSAIRLSEFQQTQQIFVGDELRPLDVVSAFAYHGQNTAQNLGCSLIFKQL